MDRKPSDNVVSLSKKAAANRRNAQLSTGPSTEKGKSRSRRNALKHGILASALLITKGEGAEDGAEFVRFLDALNRDYAPVGALEEVLVQKIAVCWWREKRALPCEVALVRRSFLDLDFESNEERALIRDHPLLPSYEDLERILRYETAIHRQMVYSISQLERLQRARKGEHIPAPVSVQLSSDHESL